MAFTRQADNLWHGALGPQRGELAALWRDHEADVIVGHPTFGNADNVGRQLAEGIRGAAANFPGRRVSFVVSDGTWTAASGDETTMEAALADAGRALDGLGAGARAAVQVVVTPYEGYGGDATPGKGSALKLLFDEMANCQATLLILLDGDLRNDMGAWQGVFARVEAEHRERFGDRPFFVTARYARHFVDASLTRFIVGPLTTLMGRYVPGGISGDIVLSSGAVAHERESEWTERRRKYGTDISTTFDNAADAETVIYEIYLGAKLHDITDEGKLSVMPAEVIGAALERLLHWEAADGRVSRLLMSSDELVPLEGWGPEKTGIGFVDPGCTDVFDVDTKLDTLVGRYPDFAADIRVVLGDELADTMAGRVEALRAWRVGADGPLVFLGVDAPTWIGIVQRAVAFALVRRQVEPVQRCLNYFYTAAFLEFVRERLSDLGLRTLAEIRAGQGNLGVEPSVAESFYRDAVDAPCERLAQAFFAERRVIATLVEELRG